MLPLYPVRLMQFLSRGNFVPLSFLQMHMALYRHTEGPFVFLPVPCSRKVPTCHCCHDSWVGKLKLVPLPIEAPAGSCLGKNGENHSCWESVGSTAWAQTGRWAWQDLGPVSKPGTMTFC